MSAYKVRAIDRNTSQELSFLGEFYIESRALHVAQKESRAMTSQNYLVVVEVNEPRRGYPKVFRMGRLFRI